MGGAWWAEPGLVGGSDGEKLGSGEAAEFFGNKRPFLAICREKCRFFVSYRDSSAAGSDDGALIGEAAVQKLIEKAEAKVKNKEELVYDDVAMCIAFAWLLDAADRDKVSKLTQEASCVHVKGEPATASASSSRKAPTPKKETCKSMVQSLFRKKKSI